MNKSTLFTLFVVVIVVVVSAEFLVNNYGLEDQDAPAPQEAGLTSVWNDPGEVNEDSATERLSDFETLAARITFSAVQVAGFEQVTLQRVVFNGALFERVDLREFQSVPVVQQHLLRRNIEQVASFSEFHADDPLLASEVYLLIQEQALQGLGVNVNETNDFGERSFYLNYVNAPETAFLVVKMGGSVYALSYQKELHDFIVSLLSYLSS